MGLLECLEECVVAVWASVFTCLGLLDCVSYQYMCGGVNIGHWDMDVEIQLGGDTIINNSNNNNKSDSYHWALRSICFPSCRYVP